MPAPKKKSIKFRQRVHALLRAAVQVLFFLTLPSAYSAAFAGIKNIFTLLRARSLLTLTPFLSALILLLLYTILFGRFFCGYACAFGSLGDWLFMLSEWIRTLLRKLFKKKKKAPAPSSRMIRLDNAFSCLKYLILAAVVILIFFGRYDRFRGTSPWDVFSMLRALKLPPQNYRIGVAVLILIAVGMMAKERFFCRYLCPMGAVFSMLPILPVWSLRRNREQCLKGCSRCSRTCPASLELTDVSSYDDASGECFQCGKCAASCPKPGSNIRCKAFRMTGNEWWFVLIRAALLFGLLHLAGI